MPEGVADLIDKIQRSFLWRKSDNKKGINLVTWEKAIPLKDMGGLGLGSLRMQNTALLLKWWWRLGKEMTSLSRMVVCHKYKLDSSCWLVPFYAQ